MIGFLARMSRTFPLLIILAVLAGVAYLILSWWRTPTRAKEILIKVFTWIGLAIVAAFAVVTLYALVDGNIAVTELAIGFMLVGALCLIIARLCNRVFLKHNPGYKDKPQQATVARPWPWEKR